MKTMISVDEALAIIRAACMPLAVEQIALGDARGRVLATPIDAKRALPPFDNAAMDGFALRWQADLAAGSVLPVLAEQVAGDGVSRQTAGACSIMTGARIPDGLDTVVPVEDCTIMARDKQDHALTISLDLAPRQGQHLRHAGEDVASGERVLEAGTRLGDEALMVLRGIGIAGIDVHRRPRLALACTGRELVDVDGAELVPGQIANTNGPYLESLFADAGAEFVERLTIPDEPALLAAQLRRWFEAGIEIVVTTGAVSMGRYDFVPDVLREIGAIVHFHKLRMRPGKPLLFASIGPTLVFGLPGNPVSSTVGARFFVDAAIRRLGGLPDEGALQVPLADTVRKKAGFSMFQKAALQPDAEGRLQVRAIKGQESFKTAPLLTSNAWLVLPEAAEQLTAGTIVPVHPLRPGAGGFRLDPTPC